MRIAPPLATLLLLGTHPLTGGVLLFDDFNGSSLDTSKWEVPTPFLGRTQIRGVAPVVSGGICRLDLDTWNPTAQTAGDSFWGSEIRTTVFYDRGDGIIVEARTRLVNPTVGGMVASVFTYQYDPGPPEQHDEIDFELLSNDVVGNNERVLTNVFEDDQFSEAGDFSFANVPGLDLTQFHVWRIEWLPDRVKWFVDGALVREDFNPVPDEAQRVHLNFWAPNSNFGLAYDGALQPVASAGQNTQYHYEVDYVRVESVEDVPPPGSTIVNGDFETGDLTGWTANGNVFFEGPPQPRNGGGSVKLFQLFNGTTNTSLVWQTLAAEAGKAYTFCGWGRNGREDGGDLLQNGNSGLLKIVWRDALGAEIGNAETPPADRILPATPPQTWTYLEASGVAPPGTVAAEVFVIHLYVGSGFEAGATWFDDLHFCEALNEDFVITSFAVDGSTAALSWESHPCEVYRVEKSTNAVDWDVVQTNIHAASAPAETTSAVVSGVGGAPLFFRVAKLP